MSELRDSYDRPIINARAEPDDEYDPRPLPGDPYLIDDEDEYIVEDDGTMDLDEDDE
jgi:hypothetical protein